jgi:hypothetical protein
MRYASIQHQGCHPDPELAEGEGSQAISMLRTKLGILPPVGRQDDDISALLYLYVWLG